MKRGKETRYQTSPADLFWPNSIPLSLQPIKPKQPSPSPFLFFPAQPSKSPSRPAAFPFPARDPRPPAPAQAPQPTPRSPPLTPLARRPLAQAHTSTPLTPRLPSFSVAGSPVPQDRLVPYLPSQARCRWSSAPSGPLAHPAALWTTPTS